MKKTAFIAMICISLLMVSACGGELVTDVGEKLPERVEAGESALNLPAASSDMEPKSGDCPAPITILIVNNTATPVPIAASFDLETAGDGTALDVAAALTAVGGTRRIFLGAGELDAFVESGQMSYNKDYGNTQGFIINIAVKTCLDLTQAEVDANSAAASFDQTIEVVGNMYEYVVVYWNGQEFSQVTTQ